VEVRSLSRVVFSRKSNDWGTPAAVYRELDQEFSFDDDPCPLRDHDYTGLMRQWGKRVFCNPPYDSIPEFVEKARRSLGSGDSEVVVLLVPARTDTAWFHEQILEKAEIRFIRGRLKFDGALYNAPFPSMVCILKP
jgi:hypothetical protein